MKYSSILTAVVILVTSAFSQRELGVRPTDTGGPLMFEQAAFDVQNYDITLDADPKSKSIHTANLVGCIKNALIKYELAQAMLICQGDTIDTAKNPYATLEGKTGSGGTTPQAKDNPMFVAAASGTKEYISVVDMIFDLPAKTVPEYAKYKQDFLNLFGDVQFKTNVGSASEQFDTTEIIRVPPVDKYSLPELRKEGTEIVYATLVNTLNSLCSSSGTATGAEFVLEDGDKVNYWEDIPVEDYRIISPPDKPLTAVMGKAMVKIVIASSATATDNTEQLVGCDDIFGNRVDFENIPTHDAYHKQFRLLHQYSQMVSDHLILLTYQRMSEVVRRLMISGEESNIYYQRFYLRNLN